MYSSFELPGPSQGALAYSDRDRYSVNDSFCMPSDWMDSESELLR